MVKKARLGFSTGGGLYEHLIKEGYLHSTIFEKSLVKSLKNKDLGEVEYVDFFGRGRIIFPCLEDDRVVGMTSRICYENAPSTTPRYKVLGKSSYTFYSPDFVFGDRVFVVEGPIDCLVLVQLGLSACCFLGTSGFKEEYSSKFNEVYDIVCIPDAEDNREARKANFKMYIKMHECLGITPLILELPRCGKGKIDPADYFKDIRKDNVGSAIASMQSAFLHETKEWKDHLRMLQDQRKKEQEKEWLLKEGSKLEKFPIIETLEKLGIKVYHEHGFRPVCRCFNPEHQDANPSVSIYEETQTFHCFGCLAGHDAIDAVRMVLGLNFQKAIDWLKENLDEKLTDRSIQQPA